MKKKVSTTKIYNSLNEAFQTTGVNNMAEFKSYFKNLIAYMGTGKMKSTRLKPDFDFIIGEVLNDEESVTLILDHASIEV